MYGYLEDGITISGKTKSYERGSKLNGFHFCENCGCVAYYLSNKPDEAGRRRIAVNIRMVTDPKLIQNLPIDHFDGLDTFEDLPRDGRNVEHLWY